MSRIISLLIIVFLASGCASVRSFHPGAEGAAVKKLSSASSAYVLVPSDAMYFTKVCVGSGAAISQRISLAFRKHLQRVEVSPTVTDFSAGMDKAKQGGFTYLISSKIGQWEDYVTEWNGRLDRIQMEMSIYDVQTGGLLDSIALEGNGPWFTFGGYHPQHIVSKALDEYIDSLF
jgi:hypothetical protein